jgi:hypothetical protein
VAALLAGLWVVRGVARGALLGNQLADLVDLRAPLSHLLLRQAVFRKAVVDVELRSEADKLSVVAGEVFVAEGVRCSSSTRAQDGRVNVERVEVVAVVQLVGDSPHAAGGTRLVVLVGARGGPGAADVLGGCVLPPRVAEHSLQL